MTQPKKLSIDGTDYIRADLAEGPPKPGRRAVVVCDRGWVFAGDVTEENGRIRLTRAVHVLSWSEIGFTGMVEAGATSKKVTLKKCADVDLPADSELFRVPVGDTWGL